MSINTSQSFKYKAALLGKTANVVDNTNSSVKEAKIVVPLNNLSNFWRSLEMPLINSKVYLELNWIEDCILSSAGDTAKFAITETKLHVPMVTLSTKDSESIAKQLNDGFERSAYWNSYETIPAKVKNKEKTYTNYLMHHFKVLKDYLFLLILLLHLLQQVVIQMIQQV